MFHLVPYWCIRRTQYIPQFGDVLQERGEFTWRLSDCEELVGDKFLNRFMTNYFT